MAERTGRHAFSCTQTVQYCQLLNSAASGQLEYMLIEKRKP